jgi:hypothetical protein
MIALLPISTNQYISNDVLTGLKLQSVPLSLIICATPGVQNSEGVYTEERVRCECNSRQRQVNTAKGLSDRHKYVLSLDRDIVLTDPYAVDQMVRALESEPDLGTVALYFGKGRKVSLFMPHVSIQCMLFRRNLFSKIDFSLMYGFSCTCQLTKSQIEAMNMRIRYLDFNRYGHEIRY